MSIKACWASCRRSGHRAERRARFRSRRRRLERARRQHSSSCRSLDSAPAGRPAVMAIGHVRQDAAFCFNPVTISASFHTPVAFHCLLSADSQRRVSMNFRAFSAISRVLPICPYSLEIAGNRIPTRNAGWQSREDFVYQNLPMVDSSSPQRDAIDDCNCAGPSLRTRYRRLARGTATAYWAGMLYRRSIGDAIAPTKTGLAAAENEPPGSVSVGTISELHSNLGHACMVRGDLAQAAASYKAALRLCGLTSLLLVPTSVTRTTKAGKPQRPSPIIFKPEAEPGSWPSRTNLVQALMATKQYIIARGSCWRLVNERPQDGAVRHQLGKVTSSSMKWKICGRVF